MPLELREFPKNLALLDGPADRYYKFPALQCELASGSSVRLIDSIAEERSNRKQVPKD